MTTEPAEDTNVVSIFGGATVSSAKTTMLDQVGIWFDSFVEQMGHEPDAIAFGFCSLKGGVVVSWQADGDLKQAPGFAMTRIGGALLYAAMKSADED